MRSCLHDCRFGGYEGTKLLILGDLSFNWLETLTMRIKKNLNDETDQAQVAHLISNMTCDVAYIYDRYQIAHVVTH